jgi:uncharacterized protein YceH (UPF0502 family)
VTPDAVELRVLGCLVEKQRTTPDAYPLSLNALRLACNQTTNRDPVLALDEAAIRSALERLSRRGWVRLASGPGSRAAKYRHLLDDVLQGSDAELSLLALLLLRGPQTAGELKARSERLYRFESLDDVEQTLAALAGRELAQRVPRRPGQKEERWAQLLGDDEAEPAGYRSPAAVAEPRAEATLAERVARLEEEVASLRAAVAALYDERSSASAQELMQ